MGRILFRKLSPGSRWLRKVSRCAEGMLLYLFWLLVRPMHPEHASAIGRMLVRRLGPKTHKHRQIKRNLILAFPDLDDCQCEALARDIWGNFGAMIAEYPHLDELTSGGSPPFISVVMDQQARAIIESRQPAIYVSAHLANWELIASTIANCGVPLSVMHGPQKNPVLERMLQKQRRTLGCWRLIAKKNGVRQMMSELRCGRSVGLLTDQRVDSGPPVPFFGRKTPTATSPAWLALKLKCPLIPVQIERTGKVCFRIVFHRPLPEGGTANAHADALQVTETLNHLFETWIRDRPDQWICMKRRWLRNSCDTTPEHTTGHG